MADYEKLLPSQRMLVSDLFAAVGDGIDPTKEAAGHFPNCGYTDENQTCGCAEVGRRIHEGLVEVVATIKLLEEI